MMSDTRLGHRTRPLLLWSDVHLLLLVDICLPGYCNVKDSWNEAKRLLWDAENIKTNCLACTTDGERYIELRMNVFFFSWSDSMMKGDVIKPCFFSEYLVLSPPSSFNSNARRCWLRFDSIFKDTVKLRFYGKWDNKSIVSSKAYSWGILSRITRIAFSSPRKSEMDSVCGSSAGNNDALFLPLWPARGVGSSPASKTLAKH